MIDLTSAYEVRDVLDNKVIDSIIDEFGNIWYEAFKPLSASGVPPITLQKCKGVDLVDYKVYGESKQGILPREYVQLDYIESNGTQYIIIDYIASGITSSKGKYQITDTSRARFLFGSRGASGHLFYGLNWGGGVPYKYYNSYEDGTITTLEIDDKVHTFYKNKGLLYIDDIFIAGRADKDFTTPYKMNVFAGNNDGTEGYLPVYAKLYYLQFYDNETLMVDLIPCYRKSDNEVGMYDLVNNVFYTNKGTGVFIKGSETISPNNPVEVESVGDKSRNLIPYPWKDTSKEENGLTFTDNGDGSVTINGIATAFTQYYFIQTKSSVIKSNVIYTLTGIKSGSSTTYELRVTDNLTSARALFDGSITFSYENTDKFSLFIYIRTGSVFDNVVIKPQVEEGEVATEFVPYNKYKIPVKVSGKNKFNYTTLLNENYIDVIDETKGEFIFKKVSGIPNTYINAKPNTIYKISGFVNVVKQQSISIAVYYTDGTYTSITEYDTVIGEYVKITGTSQANKTIDYIKFGGAGGLALQTKFKEIQISEATMEDKYEPYIEPVTTNIYLNEPLHKIGDYADYIDFEKGKVIRPIKKTQLKRAGNNYDWNEKKGAIFYSILDTSYTRNSLCLSNVSSAFSLIETQSSSSGMWMGVTNDSIYWIGVLDMLGLTTYLELNEWLKTHPVYVLYVSSLEPVEEEIELPNIPTIKGTTIIEVDTNILPSNMEVKYYGKE